MKEAAEVVGQTVAAPIFNHPQFEHLEARGTVTHGGKVDQAVAAVKRLAR